MDLSKDLRAMRFVASWRVGVVAIVSYLIGTPRNAVA